MIIRFVGFGGQGIVLSSYIMGSAATADGKNAIQMQAYGSESRGGECHGTVIVSGDSIYELEPTSYDVLVAMSQPAYEKFVKNLNEGGVLIIDEDLVKPKAGLGPKKKSFYSIKATDIAHKKFGRKIIANMVMLGFMNKVLDLVTMKSLEETITQNVPRGTEKLNLGAFKEGINLGSKAKGKTSGTSPSRSKPKKKPKPKKRSKPKKGSKKTSRRRKR
jgi:2-oxoglutarate ferredoxin oxidoreductase subunit gamma